jgi:hypothetical protein
LVRREPSATVLGALLAVLGLLAAGCTGGEEEATPATEPAGVTSTEVDSPTTTVEGPDLNRLKADWVSVWDAANTVEADRSQALDGVADQLSPEARATLDTALLSDRTRLISHDPAIEASGDTATIEDCLVFSEGEPAGASHWYHATATWDPDTGTWTVTTITRNDPVDCVPANLNQAVLDAYQAYWDQTEQYWNPPQPDHPAIATTMVDPLLTYTVETLNRLQADGLRLVDVPPQLHPEVFFVGSSTFVRVRDCNEPDLDGGVFDAAGNRQPGVPEQRVEGQRDLAEATLVFVDGAWKLSDLNGAADQACEIAPTSEGLPIIGGS